MYSYAALVKSKVREALALQLQTESGPAKRLMVWFKLPPQFRRGARRVSGECIGTAYVLQKITDALKDLGRKGGDGKLIVSCWYAVSGQLHKSQSPHISVILMLEQVFAAQETTF